MEDAVLATAEESSLGRVPNLLVIGVSKAGTTSLFEYLGRHPDIGLPDLKELRYFSPIRYGQPLEPLTSYTQHFQHCVNERYAMEASAGYFYGGGPLARSMHETCGSARVVLSLREPGDRCWSWFRFMRGRMRIPQDLSFDDYLSRCEELHRTGEDAQLENQAYWGLGGGCYANWLDDWVDEFGNDLRLVFFDDLVRDPRGVVKGLFDWLGLDPDQATSAPLKAARKTEEYRNRTAQRAVVAVGQRGERFFTRHPGLARRLRSGYYAVNKGANGGTMTPTSRERLDRFYQSPNARLEAQLQRLGLDIPEGWSNRVAR